MHAMKKPLFLFSLLLLSVLAFSQYTEKTIKETTQKEPAQLVFFFEKDQFYYSLQGAEKVKMDTVARQPIIKIIDSTLAKAHITQKDLTVIIDGNDMMSSKSFETLLDTLMDKKIYQIKIRTSLYD
jgi:hypothetical protein